MCPEYQDCMRQLPFENGLVMAGISQYFDLAKMLYVKCFICNCLSYFTTTKISFTSKNVLCYAGIITEAKL